MRQTFLMQPEVGMIQPLPDDQKIGDESTINERLLLGCIPIAYVSKDDRDSGIIVAMSVDTETPDFQIHKITAQCAREWAAVLIEAADVAEGCR